MRILLLLILVQVSHGLYDSFLNLTIHTGEYSAGSYDKIKMLNQTVRSLAGHPNCRCVTNTTILAASGLNATIISNYSSGCLKDNSVPQEKWNEMTKYKCIIDVEECDVEFRPINGTNNLGFSYDACGFNQPDTVHWEIEGKTIKVMYVPESSTYPYLAVMSGTCENGYTKETQAACTGLAYEALNKMKTIGKFNIEYVDTLPESFWGGLEAYCKKMEGSTWGTSDWTGTPTLSLCQLQKWTVCAYAAGLGYVDYCPNGAVPTEERLSYSTGMYYRETWNSLYVRSVSEDSGTDIFKLLGFWSPMLGLGVLLWVLTCSFFIRILSGYYNGFFDVEFSKTGIIGEFIDILWFGGGLFVDVIFPQFLPTQSAKFLILTFELTQIFLLATITAALTLLFVAEQGSSRVASMGELISKGEPICFLTESSKNFFESAYPEYGAGMKQQNSFASWDVIDKESNCTGIIAPSHAIQMIQAEGKLCNWKYSDGFYMDSAYAATSMRIERAMSVIWNTYSQSNYIMDYDLALKKLNRESTCAVTGGKSALSVGSFGGLLIMWGGALVIGFLIHWATPDRIVQNHELAGICALKNLEKDYTYADCIRYQDGFLTISGASAAQEPEAAVDINADANANNTNTL